MINILDQNTINKIAAGEVIERPSSIVKELLENSIDAKANKITIEIRNGGKTYIRVTDNGIGIEKNEIKKAFLSHATSKIRNIDDLQLLISFGFRGEALPSISSVSKLTIETKTENSNTGFKYVIEYGKDCEIKETALNDGTTITVENVFDNVPVRKNFLLSDQTEAAKIFDLIQKISLSNPSISFKYIQDGKEKLHTSGDNSLKNIIYTIYGKECVENLIEVKFDEDIHISGYIAKPDFCRNNRNEEIFFINNRYVKNAMVFKAIEDAYKPYLMQHKFPFTVLFINLEPNFVDVNVHPSKAEVRFANNNHIYGVVNKTIVNALSNIHSINSNDENTNPFSLKYANNVLDNFENKINNSLFQIDKNIVPHLFPKSNNNFIVENKLNDDSYDNISNQRFEQSSIFDNANLANDNKKNYKIIGQLFDTYVLIEADDSLYILDQHAAHEKMYFEKFMKRINEQFDKGLLSQKVFPEIIISLNPMQLLAVEKYNDILNKLGFTIEIFGDNDVKISSVPFDLPDISRKDLLLELFDNLNDLNSVSDINLLKEKIASMSCKKAVKANHKLSLIELDNLIKELFKMDNPFNCPHGRPTLYKLSHNELDKKFKRIL